MASRQTVTLTIASGATASAVLATRSVRELSIMAPDTLTGSITLYSGSDEAGTATAAVQSPPGTDVTVTADKTTVLTSAPFPSIQLVSSVAEAADREFIVCLVVGE